jgi:hypothetical protein
MPRVGTGDITKYHEYYDNALRIVVTVTSRLATLRRVLTMS